MSSPELCRLFQATVSNWISSNLTWIMCQVRTALSGSQACSVDQGLVSDHLCVGVEMKTDVIELIA